MNTETTANASNRAGVEAILREIQALPNFACLEDWSFSIFRDGKETVIDASFVEEVEESIRLDFDEAMRAHEEYMRTIVEEESFEKSS